MRDFAVVVVELKLRSQTRALWTQELSSTDRMHGSGSQHISLYSYMATCLHRNIHTTKFTSTLTTHLLLFLATILCCCRWIWFRFELLLCCIGVVVSIGIEIGIGIGLFGCGFALTHWIKIDIFHRMQSPIVGQKATEQRNQFDCLQTAKY